MRLWGQFSMNTPEKSPTTKEYGQEKNPITPERFEELSQNREKEARASMENAKNAEKEARAEALETAISIEENNKKEESKNTSSVERNTVISKKQREDSFNRTMKRVQSDLPISQKVFSKIIHNKTIEKTSELVGSTVARPNSILYGSIFAFIFTLLAYLIAKTIGYRLSGFETILSFSIGWMFGLIFDYLKLLYKGHK